MKKQLLYGRCSLNLSKSRKGTSRLRPRACGTYSHYAILVRSSYFDSFHPRNYARHYSFVFNPRLSISAAVFSLPWLIARVILENKSWLAISKIEDHFRKITVCPCKPRARVIWVIVDILRLVNESKSHSVLAKISAPNTNLQKYTHARLRWDRGHSWFPRHHHCQKWRLCGTWALKIHVGQWIFEFSTVWLTRVYYIHMRSTA